MVDLVIDVGHGRRRDGVMDWGTIGAGGEREHEQAHRVVKVATNALARSGISFSTDDHGTAGFHDLNWQGSVPRVNALRPTAALEIHFDWRKAPPGGFGIHYPYRDGSGPGKRLSSKIAEQYRARGLDLRYGGTYSDTRGLAFVRSTKVPAVIWECTRIGTFSEEQIKAMGEAIAQGAVNYLDKRWVGEETTEIDWAVVVSWDDSNRNESGRGWDSALAYSLGKRWMFTVVPASELAQGLVSAGWVVGVGDNADNVAALGHRGGTLVTGATRYDTADIVHSLMVADPPHRREPWAHLHL